MRNIVILNSLHFSYPLPILMRVSYNTLIVKQNTSDYYKYSEILDENVANVVLLRTKTFGVCFYFRNIFFILQKEFVQMQQRMNKTII